MTDDLTIPILFAATGIGLVLLYWAANWWDNRHRPASTSTSTAVVHQPIAVVKPPAPAGRELRQTTAQLVQAGRANRALTARLEEVLAKNQRLRAALEERPPIDPWHPTNTIEVTEADFLSVVDYHQPVRSIDWDYLASMLDYVPSRA